jgi:hypothetical protein
MHERRDNLGHQIQYLVLCRACAELYQEVSSLLADWPDVVVVVDRRRVEKAPRGYLDPVLQEAMA